LVRCFTYYGIANRRVLILQEGQKRKTQFSFLDSIPGMTQGVDGISKIWLGSIAAFSRSATVRNLVLESILRRSISAEVV